VEKLISRLEEDASSSSETVALKKELINISSELKSVLQGLKY